MEMYRPELFGKKEETTDLGYNTTDSNYNTSANTYTTQMYSEEDDSAIPKAIIKVIGVGGGGGNAVNRMIKQGLHGVEFWVMNTDAQALSKAETQNRIRIGNNVTKGLGCGADPAKGQKSAEESKDEILKAIEGSHMVFITAGMGGGTGTGAAPVIAQMAKQINALTVAVVTKPFEFEGPKREKIAIEGIEKLRDVVDAIIVIPNQKLLDVLDKKKTANEAYMAADNILMKGVQGITDIITYPGLINVDFADVETVMKSSGTAIMGMGRASGEGRAVEAAKQAISHPLLETSIVGASGVIVNITSGPDIGIAEISEANRIIRSAVSDDATYIFGQVQNDKIQGDLQITVIATGFEMKNVTTPLGMVKNAGPVDPLSSILGGSPNIAPANSNNITPSIGSPNLSPERQTREKAIDILDLPPFFQK